MSENSQDYAQKPQRNCTFMNSASVNRKLNKHSTELELLNSLWGLETGRNRVIVPARQATKASGIHSLESILGLHKRLKIRALYSFYVVTEHISIGILYLRKICENRKFQTMF
jgi:hypothetical protein